MSGSRIATATGFYPGLREECGSARSGSLHRNMILPPPITADSVASGIIWDNLRALALASGMPAIILDGEKRLAAWDFLPKKDLIQDQAIMAWWQVTSLEN